MSTSKKYSKAYGVGKPFVNVFNAPIVAERRPNSNDKHPIGTIWIDKPNDDIYEISSVVDNAATWINAGGADGEFDTLSVGNSLYSGNNTGDVRLYGSSDTTATTSITVNSSIGYAVFTALTTASGSTATLTINNSVISEGSPVIVTAANAGSADAKMTVERVKTADGVITVYLKNNGTAALNGNLYISFIVLW